MHLVFAVNPILETGGQIAAIVICVFALIFVLISIGFNLALAFVFTWVRQKIELIKMLRPTVNSVNKTTESAIQGVPPATSQNPVVRTVASVPGRVHALDQSVDRASDRVAKTLIEVRARTVQAQTVVKAFFLPGLMTRAPHRLPTPETSLATESAARQRLMEQRAPEVPVEPERGDGYAQEAAAIQQQRNHVPAR